MVATEEEQPIALEFDHGRTQDCVDEPWMVFAKGPRTAMHQHGSCPVWAGTNPFGLQEELGKMGM